mgnify:CR=1 FL=1
MNRPGVRVALVVIVCTSAPGFGCGADPPGGGAFKLAPDDPAELAAWLAEQRRR